MTWITNIHMIGQPKATCTECKHVDGCQIWKVAHLIGSMLTNIDRCCDGHTAGGTAELHCAGFESSEGAKADGDAESPETTS